MERLQNVGKVLVCDLLGGGFRPKGEAVEAVAVELDLQVEPLPSEEGEAGGVGLGKDFQFAVVAIVERNGVEMTVGLPRCRIHKLLCIERIEHSLLLLPKLHRAYKRVLYVGIALA